ncbi:hypothetical protein BIW11_07369 [Tropilaelaps mercedesae]|uniref:Uncharacterized protein n=1 Tax=Tropilaelaps mercedesae TaxID=418985 RepID=A0A1V9XUE5_9ACAR|nr:hypothetical protein BIW11_07369 [Tropilaelaps mercedesae]
MLKCLRYRIPRTKQEIQLRLHKRALTKNFKRYLDMLTVNTETNFDDALNRVRVLRDADLSGFERKSSIRRTSPSESAAHCLKDQCIALSLPEICHAGQNNIALLPLDISVVKKILRHQHSDLSGAAEREGRENKENKDNYRSDNEDSETL